MFCPQCKVEYRPGFSECADCRIPLVNTLAHDRPVADATAASDDPDTPVMLWDGFDPRPLAAIRAALDANHIPYNNEPQETRVLRTLSLEPLQIWIRKADEEAARKILSDTGVDDGEDAASPDTEPASASEPAIPEGNSEWRVKSVEEDSADDGPVDDVGEDFDPDEATCEAWSGDDQQMASIFQECLFNVGIGSVIHEGGGKIRILVIPSAEQRAREVVREIIEGTPSQ